MSTSRATSLVLTHLRQQHAAERAQVAELRILRDVCDIPAIAAVLEQHIEATKLHGDLLEARLVELGDGGSVRQLAMAFAPTMVQGVIDRFRAVDPFTVLRDAIAAEAGEIISYQLLELEAARIGDEATVVLAQELRADEEFTRDALMGFWHQAAQRHLQDCYHGRSHPARAALVDQLRDVHAIERTAAALLGGVLATVSDPTILARVEDHRTVTVLHGERVATRLRELDSSPSSRRLVQGAIVAIAKAPLDMVRRERAIKDARDMYLVEQLELIAYAQLGALADLAGDDRTALICVDHAAEETHMLEFIERDLAAFVLESMQPVLGGA